MRDEANENFRRVAVALARRAKEPGQNTVLFAGANRREGTTTTVLNVARQLSLGCGLRPLIVELNPHQPAMARLLRLDLGVIGRAGVADDFAKPLVAPPNSDGQRDFDVGCIPIEMGEAVSVFGNVAYVQRPSSRIARNAKQQRASSSALPVPTPRLARGS